MFPHVYKISTLLLLAVLTSSCGAFTSAYRGSELNAREAVLKDDLLQMRKLIDQYSADHGELPRSLDDLVKEGYLHQVPEDPITGRPDWKLVTVKDPNSKAKGDGIIDIRSSSHEKSIEGARYDEW